MPYKSQIRTLDANLKMYDSQIAKMEVASFPDEALLVELKTKRTSTFNELRRLNKLQWEEDHERVNFDDDR